MLARYLVANLGLCAVTVVGQSLLTVLEQQGFTDYAQVLRQDGDAVLNAGPNIIVYAPTNAALALESTNGTASITRRATDQDRRRAQCAMGAVDASAPRPPRPPKSPPSGNSTGRRLVRDVLVSRGSSQVTLLDNPEFVNLGPLQRNQSIVEKGAASTSLPLVFSGFGASVSVTGADIVFDGGIIRPINGLLTLPGNLSATIPLLGIDKFLLLAQRTGLLAELDAKAGPITILAPDDSAFTNLDTNTTTNPQLKDLLKQHILVDFPAYTPLLENGDVYPTLAGGNLTVTVVDGVVSLNGAKILSGDAIITNGAVHTIDKVLGAFPAPPPVTGAANSFAAPLAFWEAAAGIFLVGMVMGGQYLN